MIRVRIFISGNGGGTTGMAVVLGGGRRRYNPGWVAAIMGHCRAPLHCMDFPL